mmetsp:Transcript_49222/g.151980  ORF Transcript_49222/g.151980 Transcript_49222/m.151980 type:complete len:279 (+) Transcript_49222:225-1061(+)
MSHDPRRVRPDVGLMLGVVVNFRTRALHRRPKLVECSRSIDEKLRWVVSEEGLQRHLKAVGFEDDRVRRRERGGAHVPLRRHHHRVRAVGGQQGASAVVRRRGVAVLQRPDPFDGLQPLLLQPRQRRLRESARHLVAPPLLLWALVRQCGGELRQLDPPVHGVVHHLTPLRHGRHVRHHEFFKRESGIQPRRQNELRPQRELRCRNVRHRRERRWISGVGVRVDVAGDEQDGAAHVVVGAEKACGCRGARHDGARSAARSAFRLRRGRSSVCADDAPP